MPDPAVALLAGVARSLGDLRERVVFIGGAVAPLLQTDPPFSGARPTTDVDAIAVTVSYSDFGHFQDELRGRGFRENMAARHAHQWLAPGDPPTRFDLVPAGSHLGASGNPFDQAALRTAERLEIEPGIRHASAPAFLALKLAAYRDRGEDDPFVSHDLEDILALLASRPGIVAETAAAPADIRAFIAARAELLVRRDDLDDLVAGHLGNVDRRRAAESVASVHRSLAALAAVAG